MNSIIIIKCIDSRAIISLIIISLLKCVGSIYFVYKIDKFIKILFNRISIYSLELVVLVLLGLNTITVSIMAIFIVTIVVEILFELWIKISYSKV